VSSKDTKFICNRIPINNDTTTVPANRSITAMQDALVKHGASGMLEKYEQGIGRIEALQFLLRIKNQDVAFSLPIHWRTFQRVLELQQVRRWEEEEYVYRVAWRNIRDWVMAQLALYETEIVEMPQVFLPFATDAKGQTLYDKMLNGKLLLGQGPQEDEMQKLWLQLILLLVVVCIQGCCWSNCPPDDAMQWHTAPPGTLN
jgi:hypothetical protein